MDTTLTHYANAFFALAEENNKLNIYFDDVLAIKKVFMENKELLSLLTNYLLNEEERIAIIDKVFAFLNEENSRNFLKVIMSNHKLNYVEDIMDCFHDLYNNKFHIEKGIIYSSIKLNEDQISKIEKAFYAKKKQKVQLENKIDESLIGGIKVIIKDHIYDGSIKNQLESLKSTLKKEGDNL